MIALFVALGGSVYAASSMNGKMIRKGTVPGNRLVPDSVTGSQVKEAALGTVPSAQSAASAAHADQADKAGLAAKATTAESANTATKANSATTATTAANATNATNAGHATNADHALNADHAATADTAVNSQALAGLGAASFQQSCAAGAIKAFGHITANVLSDTEFRQLGEGQSCFGPFEARHDSAGVYTIRMPGFQNSGPEGLASGGIAVSTDPNKISIARVKHTLTPGLFIVEFFQDGNANHDDTAQFDVVFY
jgi:hypothetical protein